MLSSHGALILYGCSSSTVLSNPSGWSLHSIGALGSRGYAPAPSVLSWIMASRSLRCSRVCRLRSPGSVLSYFSAHLSRCSTLLRLISSGALNPSRLYTAGLGALDTLGFASTVLAQQSAASLQRFGAPPAYGSPQSVLSQITALALSPRCSTHSRLLAHLLRRSPGSTASLVVVGALQCNGPRPTLTVLARYLARSPSLVLSDYTVHSRPSVPSAGTARSSG
jgi:hypothetical protein